MSDSINISFGTTKDGVNANQEVEQHLIDGLKYALNQANNNLTNKITDIYIMATTNGVHSSTCTAVNSICCCHNINISNFIC